MAERPNEEKLNELCAYTKTAYNAEISGNWELAYDLHTSAKNQWTAFASTAKAFAKVDQVYKRMATRRAELHQERINTIRPFAKDGKSVPEVLVMHPSGKLATMGFSERVPLAELARAEEKREAALSLTMKEMEAPGLHEPTLPKYTNSLPDLPAVDYRIEYSQRLILGLDSELVSVTISDATSGNTVLILETRTLTPQAPPRVDSATVFRPADYPSPAFTIEPAIDQPTSVVAEAIPFSTRVLNIPGFETAIDEAPDRLRKRWGPSRFTYGGRNFVRHPLTSGVGFTVHEYDATSPKPGSKTGKLADDAVTKPLMSFHSSRLSVSKHAASAAAGLDPLFKEYLLVVQMMRLCTDRLGALPPALLDGERKHRDPKSFFEGILAVAFLLAGGG